MFNWSVPLAVSLALAFGPKGKNYPIYGDAGLWCWINDEWHILRLVVLLIPGWIACFCIFVLLGFVGVHVYRAQRKIRSLQRRPSRVYRRSSRYPRPNSQSKRTAEVQIMHESVGTRSTLDETTNLSSLANSSRDMEDNTERGNIGPHPSYELYSVSVTGSNGIERQLVGRARSVRTQKRPSAVQQLFKTNPAVAYACRAALFFYALLITWTACSIGRLYAILHLDHAMSFGMTLAACITIPFMGFWTAVTYSICSIDSIQSLVRELRSRLIV